MSRKAGLFLLAIMVILLLADIKLSREIDKLEVRVNNLKHKVETIQSTDYSGVQSYIEEYEVHEDYQMGVLEDMNNRIVKLEGRKGSN